MSSIPIHPDFVEFRRSFCRTGLRVFGNCPSLVHPDFVEFVALIARRGFKCLQFQSTTLIFRRIRRIFSRAASRVQMSPIPVHPDFIEFDIFGIAAGDLDATYPLNYPNTEKNQINLENLWVFLNNKKNQIVRAARY